MKAYRCHAYGDYRDLTIQDLPNPKPGVGEVHLRVRTAGVGFVEMLMVQGKYQLKPDLPFTPGGECTGEVIDVGEGVTEFKPSDIVMGGGSLGVGLGVYSDEVTVLASNCRLLPKPFSLKCKRHRMSSNKITSGGCSIAYPSCPTAPVI